MGIIEKPNSKRSSTKVALNEVQVVFLSKIKSKYGDPKEYETTLKEASILSTLQIYS